jgi:hypothetical protein
MAGDAERILGEALRLAPHERAMLVVELLATPEPDRPGAERTEAEWDPGDRAACSRGRCWQSGIILGRGAPPDSTSMRTRSLGCDSAIRVTALMRLSSSWRHRLCVRPVFQRHVPRSPESARSVLKSALASRGSHPVAAMSPIPCSSASRSRSREYPVTMALYVSVTPTRRSGAPA